MTTVLTQAEIDQATDVANDWLHQNPVTFALISKIVEGKIGRHPQWGGLSVDEQHDLIANWANEGANALLARVIANNLALLG